MVSYIIRKTRNGTNFIFQIVSKYLYYKFLKLVIKRRDFSIISNNCYAGDFYQALDLPYNTPTVGLFFMAEDYIEFLSNLEYYIKTAELTFIQKSKYFNESKNYPIGLLNNKVEIHFLHYKSDEEANEKWNRRKNRINWDRLYIMWNDQNNFREEFLPKFLSLKFENKVFFSAKNRGGKEVVWIKKFKNQTCVPDLIPEKFGVWYYFNFAKWFNN